jgi:hypothetical protein
MGINIGTDPGDGETDYHNGWAPYRELHVFKIATSPSCRPGILPTKKILKFFWRCRFGLLNSCALDEPALKPEQ